ncbi:MAG: right-handed parallel beta-helix repeat-containing protein [Caldicoprobacterales bacterium]|jgi:hypothetical protein
MRKFIFRKVIVPIVLLCVIAGVSFTLLLHGKSGNTYYLDSDNGDDSNSGTKPSEAWKSLSAVNEKTFGPGDRILFKAGCRWSGELHPKGSGEEGNPITIGMYGKGDKPLIAGSGGARSAAVRLVNQQYWEISDLEITNDADEPGNRQGVLIEAFGAGTVINHIYLRNLYVHDVKGSLEFSDAAKLTGGIISKNSKGAIYNDFLIENCYVKNTDRSGIVACLSPTLGIKSTNVVIRNNTVESAGGDGIICYCSESPLIEYNTSINANSRAYSRDDGYACAIWPWGCNNALLQYNEAYGTKATLFGDDGTAWDCDGYNDGTIYQYNYSHDNEGGFMLLSIGAKNSVIRYNISVNDGDLRLVYLCGDSINTSIYNNTFIIEDRNANTKMFEALPGYSNQLWFDGIKAYNNIFYNLGKGGYQFGSGQNVVFDYNVFYGNHPDTEPYDPHKITADPMFERPGSGGTGFNTLDGYKLKAGSPCIDSGICITNSIDKDFWGNRVFQGLTTDIGAFERKSSLKADINRAEATIERSK